MARLNFACALSFDLCARIIDDNQPSVVDFDVPSDVVEQMRLALEQMLTAEYEKHMREFKGGLLISNVQAAVKHATSVTH